MIPYTGQYAQTDTEQVFSQAFSEQAYSLLGSRFPNLLEHIATFKVVEADLNSGKAVGTFILILGEEVIYIPVVLGEGEVRPLMMMYHKRTDMFTPLNNSWIERTLSDSQRSIGDPALQPATLNHDISLRNLVRPPNLVGRFAYASDQSYALKALDESPSQVKEAFAEVLKGHHDVLEHVLNVYDFEQVKDALRKEATKVAVSPLPEEVVVFEGDPKEVNATQFKEMFGKQSPRAFEALVTRGVAVSDSRPEGSHNSLARLDVSGNFEEIKDPGVYEVLFADGESKVCFAFRGHEDVRSSDPPVGELESPGERGGSSHRHPGVLIVTGDATLHRVRNALGRPLQPEALKGSKIYDVLYGGKKSKPSPTHKGFFVHCKDNGRWAITPQVTIRSVRNEGKVVHYRGYMPGAPHAHLVVDPSVPVQVPKYLARRSMTYLPPNAQFLRVDEVKYLEDAVIEAPDMLAMILASRVRSRGARDLKIQSVGEKSYSLDGRPTMTKGAAVKMLMVDYGLGESATFSALKEADEHKIVRAFVIPSGLDTKTAAFGQPEQGQDPYAQQMQGQDPYAQQMQQQPEVPMSMGDDVTIDPELMQQVAQAQMMDPAVLDAAVIVSLARVPELRELILGYLPNLKQGLDNFGRILLAVWIHQDSVREQVGDSAFSSLEDTLITTFKSVGDTILRLSDGTDIFDDTKE